MGLWLINIDPEILGGTPVFSGIGSRLKIYLIILNQVRQ